MHQNKLLILFGIRLASYSRRWLVAPLAFEPTTHNQAHHRPHTQYNFKDQRVHIQFNYCRGSFWLDNLKDFDLNETWGFDSQEFLCRIILITIKVQFITLRRQTSPQALVLSETQASRLVG
eukprot:SAG31_NODE_2866_length_4979_cov_3.027869_3_plen_121_part_00